MRSKFAGFLPFFCSALIFSACSDDSSTDTEVEIIGEESSGDTTIVHPTDSSFVADTSSPAGPVFSGIAAIGPLMPGGSVLVEWLDDKGNVVGDPLKLTVSDVSGAFSSNAAKETSHADLMATGDFYNFTTQDTNRCDGLHAYVDFDKTDRVNLNVLTQMEYSRMRVLKEDGLSFAEAKAKAHDEVLEALGLPADSTLFEEVDFTTKGQAGANLLAFSVAILANRSSAQAGDFLEDLYVDFIKDGKFHSDSLVAVLADRTNDLQLSVMAVDLMNYLKVDEIENFESTLMSLVAKQYGLTACSKDNIGALDTNSNKFSEKYRSVYQCKESGWFELSETMLRSIAFAAVNGECDSSIEGKVMADDKDSFTCHKNFWVKSTEAELLNFNVSKSEGPCQESIDGKVASLKSEYVICKSGVWKKTMRKPLDYSAARAMNKRLGRGMNFGNAWESSGKTGISADCGWNNCIDDSYFKLVKDAGFNSIRLPVGWYSDASRSEPYTIDEGRLSGVKDDIDKAIEQNLAVIVNFHHYFEMNNAAAKYATSKTNYENEKKRFLSMWKQVAEAMDAYPDSMVVLEIFNEPHDMKNEQLNDMLNSAYAVIRENAPKKTIMFEAGGYSKFGNIKNLELPEDGNIIVSGHYYEPYTFTHQGHGYDCNNSASVMNLSAVVPHFKEYVDSAAVYFPDINGGHIPMNLGEFGVSGQHGSSCGGNGVNDSLRAVWTNEVIENAEKYGMSWHYWGLVGVGGFEAYDKDAKKWYPELIEVFEKYTK